MPNQPSVVPIYLWCGGLFALALVVGLVLILLKRKKAAFLTVAIAGSFIPQIVALAMGPSTTSYSLYWYSSSGVLYVLSALASTLLTIFLAFRIFGSYLVVSQNRGPEYLNSAALQTAVTGILDSEMFLTTLRSTLPQGKDDPQYGLDYVPYMLHSIDERRKRAEISSRGFLLATGIAASLFAVVVMYFGYILVNEAAAGSAKSLADLSRATQEVNQSLSSYNAEIWRAYQLIFPVLQKLDSMDAGMKNKDVKDRLHEALDLKKPRRDLFALRNTIAQLLADVSKDGVAEHAFATALEEAAKQLDKYIFDVQNSPLSYNLWNAMSEVRPLTTKAEDALSKPENRTPEIIKRLALGVVISTFFLALLRSLLSLYKTRQLQVVEAERDDFAVRRFYVVFKSSQASDEQRKAVLESFMRLASANGSQPKEPTDEDAKQALDLMKEVVQAATKKL